MDLFEDYIDFTKSLNKNVRFYREHVKNKYDSLHIYFPNNYGVMVIIRPDTSKLKKLDCAVIKYSNEFDFWILSDNKKLQNMSMNIETKDDIFNLIKLIKEV